MLFIFKGCGKCGGDLIQDFDEWRCMQCGQIYYPMQSPMQLQMEHEGLQHPTPNTMSVGGPSGETGPQRERPKVRRSARLLIPKIRVSRFNEEMWWDKNRLVIYHLDQGKEVREIAEIVGRGTRQIRLVRERLRDLRSAEQVAA